MGRVCAAPWTVRVPTRTTPALAFACQSKCYLCIPAVSSPKSSIQPGTKRHITAKHRETRDVFRSLPFWILPHRRQKRSLPQVVEVKIARVLHHLRREKGITLSRNRPLDVTAPAPSAVNIVPWPSVVRGFACGGVCSTPPLSTERIRRGQKATGCKLVTVVWRTARLGCRTLAMVKLPVVLYCMARARAGVCAGRKATAELAKFAFYIMKRIGSNPKYGRTLQERYRLDPEALPIYSGERQWPLGGICLIQAVDSGAKSRPAGLPQASTNVRVVVTRFARQGQKWRRSRRGVDARCDFVVTWPRDLRGCVWRTVRGTHVERQQALVCLMFGQGAQNT